MPITCVTKLTPNYGHLRIPYYGHKSRSQTDVSSINSTPYYGQKAPPCIFFCVDFGMASQPCGSAGGLQILEIPSYVRGFHAYKDTWEPRIGEQLLLKREQHNCHDANAVAVFKEDAVVGHVPVRFAPVFSAFLAREFNKGFCETVGGPVNRGGGYGMEIPCVYKLYGANKYIERLEALLDLPNNFSVRR